MVGPNNSPKYFKALFVKDGTASGKIMLWGKHAKEHYSRGDVVELNNVCVVFYGQKRVVCSNPDTTCKVIRERLPVQGFVCLNKVCACTFISSKVYST